MLFISLLQRNVCLAQRGARGPSVDWQASAHGIEARIVSFGHLELSNFENDLDYPLPLVYRQQLTDLWVEEILQQRRPGASQVEIRVVCNDRFCDVIQLVPAAHRLDDKGSRP